MKRHERPMWVVVVGLWLLAAGLFAVAWAVFHGPLRQQEQELLDNLWEQAIWMEDE